MARRPIWYIIVASNTPYYQGATSDTEMACQHVRGNRESSVLACLERCSSCTLVGCENRYMITTHSEHFVGVALTDVLLPIFWNLGEMRVEFNYLIAVNCRREVRLAALANFLFPASHSHSAFCGHIGFLVTATFAFAHRTCPIDFFFTAMSCTIKQHLLFSCALLANRGGLHNQIHKARKVWKNTCPDAVRMPLVKLFQAFFLFYGLDLLS